MGAKELKPGMKAPAFKGISTDGEEVSLADFRGKTVVLYFYPKDNTPGCTREALSFRDARERLGKRGAVVIGVSKDSQKSHAGFRDKYKLNFPLISDPEGKIISAYGAWKKKTMFGRQTMGIERSTFLIDGDGVIRKIWRKVKVDGHADEVLKELARL